MQKQSGECQNFSKNFFAFFLELYLATLNLVAGVFCFIVTTLHVITTRPIILNKQINTR